MHITSCLKIPTAACIAPCLPQTEPNPAARAASIARDRDRYRFTFANHDVGFCEDVPSSERFSLDYLAHIVERKAQLKANRVLAEAVLAQHAGRLVPREMASRALDAVRNKVLDTLYAPARSPELTPYRARPPERLSAYRDVFQCLPPPRVVSTWRDDQEHAWQRLAGVGPVVIERSGAHLSQRIGIDAATYANVMPGDTLEAALAEGRLFECHYDLLAGIDAGATDGHRKYLTTPVGLYAVPKGGATPKRPLVPVCIQTTPHADPASVFTKQDGYAWQLAKTTLQSSDDNFHGVVDHLGRCHVLVLQVAMASYRSLAERHPVRVLLHPHFEYTFPVVNTLTQELLLPDGATPRLQSVSVRGAVELLQRSLRSFRWNAMHPPDVFADKGVLDDEVLSTYPHRDDTLPVWDAIGAFVTRYLRLYYASDADVAGDGELAAWLRELQAEDGARIRDIGEDGQLNTFAGLVRLVQQVIWRITAYHNVINYTVYDMMSFPPNLTTAQFAPPPVKGRTYDEGDLRAMLPPLELVFEILDDVWVVGNTQTNQLGQYCPWAFGDGRVWPLVADFQYALKDIELATRARDAERYASFWYLFPSRIAASIQV